MRVTVDRSAEALRIELSAAAEARRVEAAEGVAVVYDPAGRIVAIELRGVEPSALHEFTVELAGLADRPVRAAAPVRPGRPAPEPPGPPAYIGPLTWDAEAEAAILLVPFFSRGQRRLDASALARKRGSDRVTAEIVQAAGAR